MMRIIRIIILLILGAVDFLLLFREMSVFRVMSFKWVIIIYSAIVLLLIVRYVKRMILYGYKVHVKILCLLGIFISVALTVLMIVSMSMPKSIQTYSVSSVKDLKALNNVPQINRYRILITDDIDFNGKKLSLQKKFHNDIKGGGHILSNFSVKNGIFKEFNGTADGITFSNVKITYTKSYQEQNQNRNVESIVLSATGSGILKSVNAINMEDIEIEYTGSGCNGSPWGGIIIVFLILGLGVAAYEKLTGKECN